MLTEAQLAAWERVTAAASPGPWRFHDQGKESYALRRADGYGVAIPTLRVRDKRYLAEYAAFRQRSGARLLVFASPEDTAFLELVREAMPALLAEVRDVRAALAARQAQDNREPDGTT
jgi:hypothetical protein